MMLKLIAEQDAGFNNIMVVGHNPGLTDNIPTCSFIALEFGREDWNLDGYGQDKLLVFDYPKCIA